MQGTLTGYTKKGKGRPNPFLFLARRGKVYQSGRREKGKEKRPLASLNRI